ncbi:MAG: tyrosine-type recombinase/integrase [Proteobacteria bacterium]|nr:tyrosine-type recombinase/integrase [Pseudomonadota bacterium]
MERFLRGVDNLSVTEQAALYFLKTVYVDSMNTVRSYARHLVQYFRFTKKQCTNFDPEDIIAFANHLRSEGKAKRTVHAYLSAVKSFYDSIAGSGHLSAEQERSYHRIMEREVKKARKIVKGQLAGHATKVLTKTQMKDLLETVRSDAPIRDYVLISFMYATGVRSDEVVQLTWGDFHESDIGWEVQIHGKGSQDRLVFVPNHVVEKLMVFRQEIFKDARPYKTAPGLDDFPVFPSLRGNPDQGMTYNAIYKIIRKWGEIAGLRLGFGSKTISPHWLRHTLATHLLENGATLESIQHLFGHKSIVTTKNYVHADMRRHPANINLEIF